MTKKQGEIKGELEVEGDLELTGDLKVEKWIEASRSINCNGYSIEAGNSIKAGDSIEAGYSIKAGNSIKAGYSILAQLWIKAKTTISAGIYIFAGVKTWSKIQEGDDLIECSKFLSGEVKFGKLVETGLDKKTGKETITDDYERGFSDCEKMMKKVTQEAQRHEEEARQSGYEVGYAQANTESGMPKSMVDSIREKAQRQEREHLSAIEGEK